MNKKKFLTTPLNDSDLDSLKSGDVVYLSGIIYTARDAAHERFADEIEKGNSLPFDPKNQVLYYVGPTPAKPGAVIGSAGPTTASRCDPYTPLLIERGLKGMIGKGRRSDAVKKAIKNYKCVYFGAIEGTAALIGHLIQSAEVIAYEDLGAEAVRRLQVKDFPLIVINDIYGNDIYQDGRALYQKD